MEFCRTINSIHCAVRLPVRPGALIWLMAIRSAAMEWAQEQPWRVIPAYPYRWVRCMGFLSGFYLSDLLMGSQICSLWRIPMSRLHTTADHQHSGLGFYKITIQYFSLETIPSFP